MTLVVNAGPNRIDPSRTLTLRRQLSGIISRQFASIRAELYRLVVDEDAFGLRRASALPSTVDGVFNVFCPTGEGGGVDPTCSPTRSFGSPSSVKEMAAVNGGFGSLYDDDYVHDLPEGKRFSDALVKMHNQNTVKLVELYEKKNPKWFVQMQNVMRFNMWKDQGKPGTFDEFLETEIPIYRGVQDSNDPVGRSWTTRRETAEAFSKHGGKIGFRFGEGTKGGKVLESKIKVKDVWVYSDLQGEQEVVLKTPTVNAEPGRFAFASSDAKVKEFGNWIEQQYRLKVRSDENDEVWRKFIEKSFKKGAGRAYDDFMKGRKERGVDDRRKLDFYAGGRDEFLRSGFANPMQIDRLKILAARIYTDIQGATEESATKIRRALVEGLAQGKGPREIADRMSRELSVAKWRALRIARTEIVRAHAEGQLNAFEKLGVGKVGAKVEWQITRLANGQPDPRVCELCGSMAGKVFKIKDARGRIPAHPNCRCAWLPVIEEAGKEGKPKPRPRRKPTKKRAPPTKAPARKDEPARPTPKGRPKVKRPAPKKPKRKDDRDGLDRLEITFGKKKIVVRPGRPIGKPKAKSKTRGKTKTKKERIREDRKVNKPKPARTKAGKKIAPKAKRKPVARKSPPAAKRRPTRNALHAPFDPRRSWSEELVEFSRVLANVYCPTGPGGGVDPTCSPNDHATYIGRDKSLARTLHDYTGGGTHYIDVNETLRKSPAALLNARRPVEDLKRGSVIRTAVILQRGVQSAPSLGDVILYRGLNKKLGKELLKSKIGDEVRLAGFQSTSYDRKVAEDFSEGVMLEIKDPKGLALGSYSYAGQNEVLLPHNAAYRVESVKAHGGTTVVSVRQVDRGMAVGGGNGLPVVINAVEP